MLKSSLKFRKRLLFGFVSTTALVVAILVLAYVNLSNIQSEHLLVNHTQFVTRAATDLLQDITDAETAARGYFGTRENLFITSFREALPQIDRQYKILLDFVQNDPSTLEKVEELGPHVINKETIMGSYVTQREKSNGPVTLSPDRVINGKIEMDKIRNAIKSIVQEQDGILKQRQSRSTEAAHRTALTLLTAAILFILIVALLFIYISRTFNQKEAAELSTQKSNLLLQDTLSDNKYQNWLLTGLKQLAEKMQGQKNMVLLGETILRELVKYTNGLAGTIYLFQENPDTLLFCASHAVSPLDAIVKDVRLNETWIGQVAALKSSKLISGKINQDLSLSTSIITKQLLHCFIVPVFYESALIAVIELGYGEPVDEQREQFILSTTGRIGMTLKAMLAKTEMEALYHEIQQQAEELQVQQEELRQMNDELLSKR